MTFSFRFFLALSILLAACFLIPLTLYAAGPCPQEAPQQAVQFEVMPDRCGTAQLVSDGAGVFEYETGFEYEAQLGIVASAPRECALRSTPITPYVHSPTNTTVLLL